MHFQRYYLDCLAHASYLIADEETGVAAVVDPQRDVGIYLRDAEEHGWHIEHVVLTYFHADFVAGHIELRDRLGAEIHLGAKAEAEYGFSPLREWDVIEFGQVRLMALETPGHTPEGVSILVYDLAKSEAVPQAVLTGDTLFVGDVGRPDLFASVGVTADELASQLYDSIQKLKLLPNETKVCPAHGAGSLCGRQLGAEPTSTIGEQKLYNAAMRPMSREEFMKLVEVDLPDAPAYFAHDADQNRRERPSLQAEMRRTLKPLALDAVLQQAETGAQLLDVRSPVEFSAAHLAGSVNVGLDGKFATWVGSVLGPDRPIVVIAEPGREEEAVTRLGRIGFDNVAGYLEGGMSALANRADLVDRTQRITVEALHEELAGDVPPLVVDIRAPGEWESGHVEESINLPLNRFGQGLDVLPRDRRIVVHCQGGYRSSIAASLLARDGFEDVFDLVGGYKAWLATRGGRPTATNGI